MNRERLIVALQGTTALAAIAALVVVLTAAPRLSNVEKVEREVRHEIVTLQLPPGVHAKIHREGVMPGPPPIHAHKGGGRLAPGEPRRPHPQHHSVRPPAMMRRAAPSTPRRSAATRSEAGRTAPQRRSGGEPGPNPCPSDTACRMREQ